MTKEDKFNQFLLDIETALKKFRFKKDFKFHPHITLARVSFVKDKEKFQELLKIKTEEKSFSVNKFTLYKSELTPVGPIYTKLQDFQ